MFSNKPQLGLPKHYSFDIYSIRIPITEAYQGQHFDFSKGVSSKTNKKWRLMELFRLPSVRRIFLRASVYKASPGACFARATGRRIIFAHLRAYAFSNIIIFMPRKTGIQTIISKDSYIAIITSQANYKVKKPPIKLHRYQQQGVLDYILSDFENASPLISCFLVNGWNNRSTSF